MRKKIVLLVVFNVVFCIIAILFNGLGWAFTLSNGLLQFALSISIAFFVFICVNFFVLKAENKPLKLSNSKKCIKALSAYREKKPKFCKEIDTAIKQLKRLDRKVLSLKELIESNDLNGNFDELYNTANIASTYIFGNIQSIINRLIAYDNSDTSRHRDYIQKILDENSKILKELGLLIEAFSKIGDSNIDIYNIKEMTAALEECIKGKNF